MEWKISGIDAMEPRYRHPERSEGSLDDTERSFATLRTTAGELILRGAGARPNTAPSQSARAGARYRSTTYWHRGGTGAAGARRPPTRPSPVSANPARHGHCESRPPL